MHLNNLKVKKDIIFAIKKDKVLNLQLISFLKFNGLNFTLDNYSYAVFFYSRALLRHKIMYFGSKLFNGKEQSYNFNFKFKFSKHALTMIKSGLKKINANIDKKKIVCFNNRSNDYLLRNRNLKENYAEPRNSDPKTFLKTIIFLKKKNYIVFRTGDYADKLNICYELNQLPRSEKNYLELYLYSKCSFCITSSSGINLFPIFFKKPILYHNAIPLSGLSYIKDGLILPKILKKNNKIIKLKDYHSIKKRSLTNSEQDGLSYRSKNLFYFQFSHEFEINNISIQNNDEDEILNMVKDYFKYFIKLKKKFTTKYFIDRENFLNLLDDNSPLKYSGGYLSPSWLKKYKKDLF